MVAVEVHLVSTRQLDMITTLFQFLLLTSRQREGTITIIRHEVIGLERHTTCGKVALADVSNTAIYIEIPVPGGIHTPVHLVFLTFCRQIEHDFHISLLCGFQIVCSCLCCGRAPQPPKGEG